MVSIPFLANGQTLRLPVCRRTGKPVANSLHFEPIAAKPGLPRSAAQLRLRRHADFQTVYKLARKQYAKEMSFFFARRPQLTPAPAEVQPIGTGMAQPQRRPWQPPVVEGPRVGLTVGKVLGKAHDRNRIKRRLRAAVRQHAALLANLPVDVVLHPKRSVLTLDWPTVEAEVAQAFRTVRKLADKPQLPPAPRPARTKKR